MQAKEVNEAALLAAMPARRSGRSALVGDLQGLPEMSGVPYKVLLAKLRAMVKKGLCDGCACGCSGQFTRP